MNLQRCCLSAAMIVLSLCAARPGLASERSLAGIRIFSPVSVMLHMFGDPSFITPGTVVAHFDYYPGQIVVTQPGETAAPGTGAGTGLGGWPPQMDGGGSPQMGEGGMQRGVGSSAASIPDDEADVTYPDASRYYYHFPAKNLTYEFVVSSDGRVIAIKAVGYHSSVKTAKGIALGSTYQEIVNAYGYPDSTLSTVDPTGDMVTLIYRTTDHVSFRLVRNRVAVISVTAPD